MTFDEIGVAAGFEHTGQGRALLHLDYDRDGDMDIVILSSGEPMQLFRNDLIDGNRPRDARWLQIKLDTSGNPDLAPHGIGAKITVKTRRGVKQTQQVYMGGTYLGQSELVAHFGIGTARRIRKITIDWGNGLKTRLWGRKANKRITVRAPCTPRGRHKRPGKWPNYRKCSKYRHRH